MPLVSDVDIAQVLLTTRSIALVGASAKSQRPSHGVMRFLLSCGYRVYPINPGLAGQQLLGQLVYSNLAAVPVPIDMVDVFRQSRYLQLVTDEAIAIAAKTLWTQMDVVDEQAAAAAEQAGLAVVMDHCPVIEIRRLRSAGLLPEEPLLAGAQQ